MVVKSKSVAGEFVGSNVLLVVDLLSAPSEQRGNALLGVNFSGMDAVNEINPDRLVMALSMGKIPPEAFDASDGHASIPEDSALITVDFLKVFAHASLGSSNTSSGMGMKSHYVPLHRLTMVEQVDLLIYLPDNTTELEWYCDLFYEPVRISRSEWTQARHRPPVESMTIGSVTI